MFDLNSLPIPGGLLVAGLSWAVISGVVLAPIVAKRTIENTGWHQTCATNLRRSLAEQVPQKQSSPKLSCRDAMGILVPGMAHFCNDGAGKILDRLLKFDPLAQQKEMLREREAARIGRIAANAPSRCSCAASKVGADRWTWGVFAGSARFLGGPDDLNADLVQALHSPICARLGEG